jgi:hypothetical protein
MRCDKESPMRKHAMADRRVINCDFTKRRFDPRAPGVMQITPARADITVSALITSFTRAELTTNANFQSDPKSTQSFGRAECDHHEL